jgi:hypothetical protein
MRHMRNPLDVVWYYVPVYHCYFEYIEHRPNGILLDGGCCFGTPFVSPEECCRVATYEEVCAFYNRQAELEVIESVWGV